MERKVISNKFDSLESFSRWLQITPQTAKGKELSKSVIISPQRTEFTGTESFEVADNLMKFGDKENAENINATIRKIKAQGKGTETRNKLYNSPCGFMPIVPKVLAGDPQNMLAIKKQRYNSTKIINIAYNVAVDWRIKIESIIETTAKVANVIASLEKNGYRVNLYAYFCGGGEGKTLGTAIIKIKDSGKYLDTLRIAYPLVNPSFYRRHIFAYMERLKGFGLNDSYGYILNDSECEKYMPINAIYLSYYLCNDMNEEQIAKYIENAK